MALDPAARAYFASLPDGAARLAQAEQIAAQVAAIESGRAAPAPAPTPVAAPAPAPVAAPAAAPAPAADPRAGTSMSAAEQVRLLYLRDLNRLPDAAGQAFWEQRATQISPAQLNQEFRAAAQAENPQAGIPAPRSETISPLIASLRDPGLTNRAAITLPGEVSKGTSFLELAAPFIIPAIAIVAPTLLPSIGSALGATTTVGANALGSAVVNAGMAAVQGGSAADILRAGAAGAAGGAAGTYAGQAVGGAFPTDSLTGRALEAGARGAAGSGASTLVQTGDVGKALQAGAIGGLAGGAGELASVAGQRVLPADVSRTTQALVAGGLGGATEAAIQGQDPLLGGITSAGLTAGATQLRDAEAAKQAARDQVISAFMEPPSRGTQLGDPTALTSQASLPGYTVTEYAPGTEFTSSGREIAGRFEPIVVTGEETVRPELISPVLPPVVPSKITTPTKTTPATSPTATTRPPSGSPALSYVGAPQPETGPPVSAGRAPTTTPTGGGAAGGGAAAGGGMAGGGAATIQPSTTRPANLTQQIIELTGIAPRPTPRLPEVTVTGERDLDRLPEVEVTGEEEIDRLPEVEVTAEEEATKPRPDIDYIASQTFPLTPPDRSRELINYLYGNINQSPFLLQPGQMQPGTSALAQALGVGDPGASYLGKKGKERRPVWNIESLKLKDELGGDYG